MTTIEAALWPLSILYGTVARLRARAYESGLFHPRRLDANVISVGNLTVGGTGKTPMVLWIAQRLVQENRRVAILTRGYARSAEAESDEVRIFRARLGDSVSLGVSPDRFDRGRELARTGIDWFVLDDGFQHLQLARDADIVLIDALNPFGGGRLLPSGRLREPKAALGRANVIVITRASHSPAIEAAVRRHSAAPIFYAQTSLDSVCSLAPESDSLEPYAAPSAARPAALASPDQKKWFAFCGIGNPAAFIADLRAWGILVVGQRFFHDHHRYTQSEFDDLAKAAYAARADALICTEKDRFNLSAVKSLPLQTAYCRISLHIERANEFWATVKSTVAASRAQSGVHAAKPSP